MSENKKSLLELPENMNPELAQALNDARNAMKKLHDVCDSQKASLKENSDVANYVAFNCTFMYGSVNETSKITMMTLMLRADLLHVRSQISKHLLQD